MLEVLQSESSTILSHQDELIAQALLTTKGNVVSASRLDSVTQNAMALRLHLKEHPEIRRRYQELLGGALQECGLHIGERILKLAELQDKAYGYVEVDETTGENFEIPPDPKTVIDLSKEISRLMQEGRLANMSASAANRTASKQDVKELLEAFLNE